MAGKTDGNEYYFSVPSYSTTFDNKTTNISNNLDLAILGKYLDNKQAKIYYGTCVSTASTVQKYVSCPGYTRTGNPVKGDIVYVTFSYVNTASVNNITLRVGSSTAKNIRYEHNGSINLLPSPGYLANNTYRFIYNGTYWVVMLNSTDYLQTTYFSDTNTNFPLAGVTDGNSITAPSPQLTSGTTTSCAIVPSQNSKRATINSYTGAITAPGGFIGNLTGSASSVPWSGITNRPSFVAFGGFITDIDNSPDGTELTVTLSSTAQTILNVNYSTNWLYDDEYLDNASDFEGMFFINNIAQPIQFYGLTLNQGDQIISLNGEWKKFGSSASSSSSWSTITNKPTTLSGYGITDAQKKHSTLQLTLSANSWNNYSITVAANGVTSSNTVIVSFSPASIQTVADSAVYCSAQGTNTLTFTCNNTTPLVDIIVNILILPD